MWRRNRVRVAIAGVALAAAAPALFVAWPLPPALLDAKAAVRVTDRSGLLLRELRPAGAARALPLPPDPLPRQVVDAFVSVEDRRFWSHPGVDPLAIARTAWANLRARRVTGGASTITQQLARQLVPRPRTLAGKAYEALWALRLSVHRTREEVLRAYLDRVPQGNGLVGVETAAQAYFARPAARLSVAQAALLAGLASAPERFDPLRRPERARERMRHVLACMVATGAVDADTARRAADDPFDRVQRPAPFRAPHFALAVAQSLPARGLASAVRLETTLDPELQAFVETAIREELSGLATRRVGEAAVLVVDNRTREILAWAGSADFFDDASGGQNDGVRARRQPGSALKPFAYGLALATGMTPADLVPDVEARFASPAGDFQPRNYDRRLHGPVRVRAALANSYNVPAVRVCDRVGAGRVLELLRAAGFDGLDKGAAHYGVGIVLGDGEVSLYELARAYAALANGGVLRPLRDVRGAWDAGGAALPLADAFAPRRILPADATALLTDIVSDEAARVPAFGLDNALRLPFPVAAKTGTSRAHVDNWTVGFTRERTVAVWVGNFDGTPMKDVSGITGAGPLFRRVMLRAMKGIVPAPLVDRARFDGATICTLSGRLAGPLCPSTMGEVFLRGTAPHDRCPMHGAAPAPGAGRVAAIDVGASYYAWARGEGFDAGPQPGGRPGAATRLLVPGDGDEYLVDPTLPRADQSIPLRAEPGEGVRTLEFALDGGAPRPLAAPFVARLAPAPGVHRLELREPGRGVVESVTFTVR